MFLIGSWKGYKEPRMGPETLRQEHVPSPFSLSVSQYRVFLKNSTRSLVVNASSTDPFSMSLLNISMSFKACLMFAFRILLIIRMNLCPLTFLFLFVYLIFCNKIYIFFLKQKSFGKISTLRNSFSNTSGSGSKINN